MTTRFLSGYLVLLFIAVPVAYAQQATPASAPVASQTPSPTSASSPPKAIQDNSFLIEEAYNQDEGVVQHINTFTRQRHGEWLYTFTQEWPVASQKHQLSYTIPVERVASDAGKTTGIGDIALNYRYQLVGDGDAKLAIAPRLSLLVPTGDEKKGRGAGSLGIQFSLPVSLVLSRAFITHFNAGMTYTHSAKNEHGEKADLQDYNLGQSVIWLVKPDFNLLLEGVWANQAEIVGPGRTQRRNSFQINPGIRWAYNFKNGLQIVPGISVPVGLGPSQGERGILFYLSFEHPFKKARK